MGKWFQNKSFSTEKQEQGIKARKGHRGINARKMHRAFGALLAAALIFQTVPFEGIAVSASESSGGGLCEHHRSHTPDCGYKKAEPGHGCTHEHTEECYRTVEGEDGSTTKEPDCHHEHDESCGYREAAEGSPCTFVCEICRGGTDEIPEDKTDGNGINEGDSENQGTENGDEIKEPDDGQEECICEERCTEDSINTDCPVCGAEDASLSDCKGKDTEDSTEDAEENTDQQEDTGLCKHHREHDDACGYQPASEDSEGSPCTYECRICPIKDLIAALPDKVTEDNADEVRARLEEILALFSELTEDEQEQIDLSRCYELQGALDASNDPMPLATGNVVLTDSGQKISFTVDECGNNCQGHTITQDVQSGVVQSATILVESGTHNITFSGLNLSSAAVGIMPGGTMNLTLVGTNKIVGSGCGFYVPVGATLVITEQSTGSLDISLNSSATAAGIGGAYYDPNRNVGDFSCGTVIINGGTITAAGRDYSAGIGGASYNPNFGNGGNITITGGHVTATGSDGAPGIGGGKDADNDGSLTLSSADVLAENTTLGSKGTYTINGDPTEDMIVVPELVYTGEVLNTSDIKIDDTKTGTATYFGQTFRVQASADGWVLQDLGEVKESGEYTAVFKKDNKEISKTFTVAQSGTQFVGDGTVKTYKDGTECSDFTADDTITVKATPTATGQAPAKAAARLRGDPTAGQMVVFVGDTQVSAPADVGEDGAYTMTVSAADVLTNGQAGQDNKYTLIVRFVENTNMADAEAPVEVTVTPNPLTEGMVTLSEESATYDGTEQQPNITVAGLTAGTDYDVTFQAGFKNAGTYTVTITGKGIYAGTVKKIFTIEKATPTVAWENNELELTYTGQPADIEPTVTLVNSETFSGTITYTYGVYSGPDRPTNAASYTVKASIPEQDNYTAAESGWLILYINPADQAAPAAPTAAEGNIKDTSITLDTIENAEYSKDGTNWQESPEFTELSPNTQYTFYARLKVDRNHNASPSSAAASITTKKTMLDNATVMVNGTYTYTGAAIVPETGNVTVELNGTAINSDQYTISATDNINAGEATVTVTAAANGNYSGSISTTFTIEKAEQTDFAFAAVTKSYEKNGTFTLSTTGGGGNGAVLYRVPENNGVLMVNGDQATIIGVGTVTVTATKAESENYKAATATGKITIEKAPAPTINYPTAGGITYGQKLSDSVLTGGSTEYGTFAWENGSTIPTVDNTGYTVVFTAGEETKKNYETITNTTKSVSVKVEKAAPAVSVTAAVSGSKDNRQAVLTVNVAKAGAGAFPTGTVKLINCTDSTEREIGTVTLNSSGTASYAWDGLSDQTYTIKAVYTGNGNYKEAGSRELTFDAAKQNQQDFSLDAIGAKTYGDTAITLKTTGGSGSGAVRYESSDEDVIRIENGRAVIAGAGTATVTAIKEGDGNYNEASAGRTVTVAKKALTVKADSRTVVRGNPMPAFTYRADGLVNGDTFTAAPSITAGAQNTDTLGKYDIVISGGTLQNSGSYRITYVNGTLNIVEHIYTVTVTDGTGGGEYAEGDTVVVTANERNGYTFTGWSSGDGVAFADSKAKTTTFTMPARSVTVKANYISSSGGSNGGGSGDGGNSGGSGNNGGGGGTNPGNGNTAPQISVVPPAENISPGNKTTPGTGSGSGAGTSAQGTKQPFIKGEDGRTGWDVIRAEEEKAQEGSTINVDMNGAVVVPGDIFDSIKGKDITVNFDMGNGILWSVDGKSVTTDRAGDIDFSVKTGVNTVPVDIVNNVTGESYSIQISLAYEGEFGFTAVLSIGLGKENAGYTASLYYYNENTGELEFICADGISADGTVSLAFTHASDYVIAIDGDGEEESDSAEPAQQGASDTDSAGEAESPGTGQPWWIVAVVLLAIAIGTGVVAAKKFTAANRKAER